MDVKAALKIKPEYGDKCNGCGWCCMSEVCRIGKAVHGEDAVAPCPSLIKANNRYWCSLVLGEDITRLPALIGNALGIGKGCCSENKAAQGGSDVD